jgi:hypothetical protein
MQHPAASLQSNVVFWHVALTWKSVQHTAKHGSNHAPKPEIFTVNPLGCQPNYLYTGHVQSWFQVLYP